MSSDASDGSRGRAVIKDTMSKVKYGVILLPYNVSFARILDATRRAKDLGFHSVWISDHIQRDDVPTLECWTTISAICSSTSKIRVGSLATCNSFRNPVLLAKIVATASQISNGRVDLAIGVGYDREEHTRNGYAFESLSKRIELLSETLHIVKALWKSREATFFEGNRWQIKSAICEPKPVGEIKIWVAGRNEKLISVASKAGVYGMNILPYSGVLSDRRLSSFSELASISEYISSRSLKKSIYCGDGGAIIGTSKLDYQRRLAKIAKLLNLSQKQLEERQGNLSIVRGTAEDCRESIDKLIDLGFEELMFIFPGWQEGDYSNMDLFAEEFIQKG